MIDDVAAYDEDRIHELRAGEVTLRLVKPCTRCSITTTDQQAGVVDGVEPLATLKTYRHDSKLRGEAFGQNAIVVRASVRVCASGRTFDITWDKWGHSYFPLGGQIGMSPFIAGAGRRR